MNLSRIHVYCRVRQLDPRDDSVIKSYPQDESDNNVALSVLDRSTLFSVDKLYDQHAQQEIFSDSLEPLIEDVFTGINCTVFTYGQTGSGKTHTIIGGQSDEQRGLLPRAIDNIFQRIQQCRDVVESHDSKPDFSVKVSILEIYHEKLRDLLEIKKQEQNLAIRENSDGTIWVEHLSEILINSSTEYAKLLQQALKRRVIGSHKMNDQSSRSHLCCLINLTYEDKINERVLQSKLSLIDLAGSEMAKKTEASGQRFEEAKFINKSLSALSKVIHALSTQQHYENSSSGFASSTKLNNIPVVPSHIPYRDSKLTRLLQHSLSGNAKTVIFLTISNAMNHVAETISTLKFGERARLVVTKPRINIGETSSNITSTHDQEKIAGYEKDISEYRRMVEQLRGQIGSMQNVIEDLQTENSDLITKLSVNSNIKSPAAILCCNCQSLENFRIAEKQETTLSDQRILIEPSNFESDKTTESHAAVPSDIQQDICVNQESNDSDINTDDQQQDENYDDYEEYSDRCGICGLNQIESDRLQDSTGENLGFFFHCDGNCGSMFHVRCVGLIGEAGQYILPEGEWFCLSCQHDLELSTQELSTNVGDNCIHESTRSGADFLQSSVQQQPISSSANTNAKSPSKSTVLQSTQQELHMSKVWQQQYDVIRKDRNRILAQWQNDQEMFRLYKQQRQLHQEERENCIAQLEEQQLGLSNTVSRQQEENNSLKNSVKELQDRCFQLEQRLNTVKTPSPAPSSSLFMSLSVEDMKSCMDNQGFHPFRISATAEDDISSPQTKLGNSVKGKSNHRYDAAYSCDEDGDEGNGEENINVDGENNILHGIAQSHKNERKQSDSPKKKASFSTISSKASTKIDKDDDASTSSISPKFRKQENHQHNHSSKQLPPSSSKVQSNSRAKAEKSATRHPATSAALLSSTLPHPKSSGEKSFVFEETVSLTRSASDRVSSIESDTVSLSSQASSTSHTTNSRFVNPLRNRLSELIAQAEEEKESFAELRMKLQSRSEGRNSRESLR